MTFVTTTALGVRMNVNFRQDLPAFDLEHNWRMLIEVWREPSLLLLGLPYSVTLLIILLAHEFGHWGACRWYGIKVSLPYFLPEPTLLGTFGAFVRFGSAVRNRRELFDVGFAGPLAGFTFLLPALGIGVALSRVVPGIGGMTEIQFGTPWLLRLAESLVFPGVDPADINLHPVAQAAWVGLLATALNLLPVGQLDGGHLVYAVFGDRHRHLSLITVTLLLLLGFVYWPWWVWGFVLLLIGRRHFAVVDLDSVGKGRLWLFAAALLLFALCFTTAPVQYNSPQSG